MNENEINFIEVSSQDDCDKLCAILARNGYSVTANYLESTLSNIFPDKNWRIVYCKNTEEYKINYTPTSVETHTTKIDA